MLRNLNKTLVWTFSYTVIDVLQIVLHGFDLIDYTQIMWHIVVRGHILEGNMKCTTRNELKWKK